MKVIKTSDDYDDLNFNLAYGLANDPKVLEEMIRKYEWV
jgi:hypothetical protein